MVNITPEELERIKELAKTFASAKIVKEHGAEVILPAEVLEAIKADEDAKAKAAAEAELLTLKKRKRRTFDEGEGKLKDLALEDITADWIKNREDYIVKRRFNELKTEAENVNENLASTRAILSTYKWPGTLNEESSPYTVTVDEHYEADLPMIQKAKVALETGNHIMLVGHAGTGKSSMVKHLAALVGAPLMRINLNGQTTDSNLIGHYQVRDGATFWVEGILPKAMRLGTWLLLDEADFADPAVLSLLHPVLEPSGKLFLKEHDNQVVQPAPGFRVFLTANSLGIHDEMGLYNGTNAMNHAFISRFTGFMVDFPSQVAEEKILIGHGIPEAVAKAVAKASVGIRDLIFKQKSVNGVWGPRHALDFSKFAIRCNNWKDGFDMAAQLKFSETEVALLWEATQRVTGTVLPEGV